MAFRFIHVFKFVFALMFILLFVFVMITTLLLILARTMMLIVLRMIPLPISAFRSLINVTCVTFALTRTRGTDAIQLRSWKDRWVVPTEVERKGIAQS